MMKFHAAVPASFLLLSFSIPSAGQIFDRNEIFSDAPAMQQERVDSSAIVVRPALTTEQLADLYMVRKDYREAAETYKRLTDENPRNAVYLKKKRVKRRTIAGNAILILIMANLPSPA